MSRSLQFTDLNSQFGTIGITWKETPTIKIQRIILNPDIQHVSLKQSDNLHPQILSLSESITRFLKGEKINFRIDLLELDRCSDFQKEVLLAEYGIPRGSVSTYSRIANHIGRPKAARAVGNALSSNPFPLVIPCHRAVRSDGSLGGYQGGIDMKRQLLEMEGIKIANNRVNMENITY